VTLAGGAGNDRIATVRTRALIEGGERDDARPDVENVVASQLGGTLAGSARANRLQGRRDVTRGAPPGCLPRDCRAPIRCG